MNASELHSRVEVSSSTSVTVLIPTYQEEESIASCLAAVAAQSYPHIVQVLVVDGGSEDCTREIASGHPEVTVLDNPRRIQAAALNVGLEAAEGDVIVRVDGHCLIADDYVERCVAALEMTGAAMVGGGMHPVAQGSVQEGIAAAMSSRFGAGPARFHVGGAAGWTDTVYLGAFRLDRAREAGGYAEDVGVNEDAELAHRMRELGGVWFDPSIRSTYTPRESLRSVGRQFFRYGQSRARTTLRHPRSIKPRQLVPVALVLGLASRRRRTVGWAYAVGVVAVSVHERRRAGRGLPTFVAALPVMHLSWGLGFLATVLARLTNVNRRG